MKYPYIEAVSVVSSAGQEWSAIWRALLRGQTQISDTGEIGVFPPIVLPVSAVDGLVRSVDESGRGPAADLFARLLAGLPQKHCDNVYASSNHGESELLAKLLDEFNEVQAHKLLGEPLALTDRGLAKWSYAACAGGMHALISAAFDCSDGIATDAIVVAADALSLIEIVGFSRAGALGVAGATPFAINRNGLLIGEGGAALFLSKSAPTKSAVGILGIGMSCDAYHPTDPDPSGDSLERAVRMCLMDAGYAASDVPAVIAHGTGTLKGDGIEFAVIKRVWGEHRIKVTSLKGMVGHMMGAAGLFNVAAAFQACADGILPPTAALRGATLDDDCIVTGEPARLPHGAPVLCIASGFGGNNAAILIGKDFTS